MKKIIALILSLFVAVLCLSSCIIRVVDLPGNEYTEGDESFGTAEDGVKIVMRNLSFVNFTDKVRVKITYGSDIRVSYKVDKQLADDYGFDVIYSDNTLTVKAAACQYMTDEFMLDITAPFSEIVSGGAFTLEVNAEGAKNANIDISGAVDASVFGLDTEKFVLGVSGAGQISVSGTADEYNVNVSGACGSVLSGIETSDMDVKISGMGNMEIHGSADKAEIDLSGSGKIDAKHLVCKNADVEISGAGSAEVSVTDTLEVDISGAASVTYYGSPTLSKSVSGASSVKQGSESVFEE